MAMTLWRMRVVLPTVLLCLSLAISLSATQDPEAGNQVLAKESSRFIDLVLEFKTLAEDFSSFEQSADSEIALAFANDSIVSTIEASWAADLYILVALSCDPYKEAAREHAEARLENIAGRTATRVKSVNRLLALASTHAVAQLGGDLREKLRELKALTETPLPEDQ